jgi:hypothetical protein
VVAADARRYEFFNNGGGGFRLAIIFMTALEVEMSTLEPIRMSHRIDSRCEKPGTQIGLLEHPLAYSYSYL